MLMSVHDEHSHQRATRRLGPDPDYVADLETNDGQRLKRMADRAAGKPVRRPQPT